MQISRKGLVELDNNVTWIKKAVAIIFVFMMFFGLVVNFSFISVKRILYNIKDNMFEPENLITVEDIESEYVESMWAKNELLNINGLLSNALNIRGLYSSMDIYVADDNYIISSSNYTTTNYEYEQTIGLRDFLKDNNINFLYVNEPDKYIDDSVFVEEFGVETYSNRNMDLFLDRIRNDGVVVVDLRDNIKSEGLEVSDMFYRTDHHWTTLAGLWATKIMAEALNENFGYSIDTSIYDLDKFDIKEWNESWLGEQGRKVGKTYVGLDDFTRIKPKYETSFTFKSPGGKTWQGTFDDFIIEDVYNTENDVYDNETWHYSYARIDAINNNVEKGKILLLGDSYDHVTEPFLALGVHEVDSLIIRNYDESVSLRNYILENEYDTVIVAYAQFMVGQHDDSTSSNYRMFTFEY